MAIEASQESVYVATDSNSFMKRSRLKAPTLERSRGFGTLFELRRESSQVDITSNCCKAQSEDYDRPNLPQRQVHPAEQSYCNTCK